MKLAKAMRYGGELIDACNCDYSDFKSLIPLCPNCSEPVFLRKDSDRISKLGKEFKIPKHWSHFGSTSEEQKAACEARVSSYTEADRQRIQSQARGQRLKLIQRWFWKIVTRNNAPPVLTLGNHENGERCSWSDIDLMLEQFGVSKERIESLEEIMDYGFQLLLNDLAHLESKIMPAFWKFIDETPQTPHQWAQLKDQLGALEKTLHSKIVMEVFSFLGSKSIAEVRRSLAGLASKHLVVDLLLTPGNHREGIAKFLLKDDMSYADEFSEVFSQRHAKYLFLVIFSIPWASEFASLKTDAGQKLAA
jgi:hypothetical protein